MSTSVCVCLSVREDIPGTTLAICTKCLVHIAYMVLAYLPPVKAAKSAVYDCLVKLVLIRFISNLMVRRQCR